MHISLAAKSRWTSVLFLFSFLRCCFRRYLRRGRRGLYRWTDHVITAICRSNYSNLRAIHDRPFLSWECLTCGRHYEKQVFHLKHSARRRLHAFAKVGFGISRNTSSIVLAASVGGVRSTLYPNELGFQYQIGRASC